MNADLVLEGGGVKGIGLVGAISALEEAGYEFQRVAGTSAGAIVGSLVAAGMPADQLEKLMREIDYTRFKDQDLIDRLGLLGKGLSVLFDQGIYEGNFLKRWLGEHLESLGVRTFGDLRIAGDRGTSLPPARRYKLVVMAADLSLGRLVRLPWDYERYGLKPDEQPVVDAVRASMSIPFFYEPVKLHDRATNSTSYLVDGGLLSNFPIDTFDRTDGKPPRWPTFGIKLSAKPDANQVPNKIDDTPDFAKAMIATMVSAHDQMHLDDPCVVRRTMFVDTLKVRATDFDIDPQTQQTLFRNGVQAATEFLSTWDFTTYVKECRR